MVTLDTLSHPSTSTRTRQLSSETPLRRLALAAIVLLAAALRFINIGSLGYVNHYYAAGVESMLQSWHNFYFVAAEPGGSVSIDKPPVGLWIQTASAAIFGVNAFGLLLPEILAGILSIVLVYHLVRRWFGTAAGLLAGLALAVTPVVVATDRNNTIDSLLIFTLLLATWAFIKATETSRLRWLMAGAALVGIGFNIKMMEAYLPLPALLALFFFGAAGAWWTKLGKLFLAGLVILVVSLSWAVSVDLTPADQRPYVGSSSDNSVMSLIVGYNGLQRLMGMGGRGGLLSSVFSQNGFNPGAILQGAQNPFGGQAPRQGQFQPGQGGARTRVGPGALQPNQGAANGGQRGQAPLQGFPSVRPDGQTPNQGVPGGQPPQFGGGFPGGPGGGFAGTGRAGITRLFTTPLSKEVSWLLPFGLFTLVLLAFRARPHWPFAVKHHAIILWGGWLLTAGAFFSVAGFFHEYYLSTLGPPLAALVGIGVIELWRVRARWPWLGIGLLLAIAAVTLWFQRTTALAFVQDLWWQPIVVGLFGVGAALMLLSLVFRQRQVIAAGFTAVAIALLVTPGIWSGFTTAYASDNQSLPAAYGGRVSGPVNRGGLQVNPQLLDFLLANTQQGSYLMAVPSSMQGADYVLKTGRPVLYLGGFMGQDKVETPESLAELVAAGQLRYVYWTGGRGGFGGGPAGGNSAISSWISQSCQPVQGFDTQTRNAGAPDGTNAADGGTAQRGFGWPGGALQVSLYDCSPGI